MAASSKRRINTEDGSSNVEVKRRQFKSPSVVAASKHSTSKHVKKAGTSKNSVNIKVDIPKHVLPQTPSTPSPTRKQHQVFRFIFESPQSPLQIKDKNTQGNSSDTQLSQPSKTPTTNIQPKRSKSSSKTSKHREAKLSKVGKENASTKPQQNNITKSVKLDKSIVSSKNNKSTSIFTTKPRSTFKVFIDGPAKEEQDIKIPSVTEHYMSLAKTARPTSNNLKYIDNSDSEESHTPYIVNIPNECLYSIFMLCDDLTTKCTITRVCKKWRILMLGSSNWKKATTSLADFQHYLTTLKNREKTRCFRQHIRKLTTLCINHFMNELTYPDMSFPKAMPFIQLSSLKLDHLFYGDLLQIIDWVGPAIQRLECRNIRPGARNKVCLASFYNIPRLRVLILEFQQSCNHISSRMFNLTGRPVEIGVHFPKLKELSFLNYHDMEEYSAPAMDSWFYMERVLHSKYDIFTTMKELRSLALNRCNAFTASIWRDCLTPCARKLQRLSLTGWEGRGYRQSPMAQLERRPEAGSVYGVPDEVELALAVFIESLVSIKSIHLNEFYCGHGLVLGLHRLGKAYRLYGGDNDVIDNYMDKRLNQFKITFN